MIVNPSVNRRRRDFVFDVSLTVTKKTRVENIAICYFGSSMKENFENGFVVNNHFCVFEQCYKTFF